MNSLLDELIIHFDRALRTAAGVVGKTDRDSPASEIDEDSLTQQERQNSARLMRVNHCGEVCAQALYNGQALTARSSRVARSMQQAAMEETDHLSWCEDRIKELDSHVSYLNPLWYGSSFCMGIITGLLGDKINLGFVAATEEQVCQHLEDHLEKLPEADKKSRAILIAMKEDESRHQQNALASGGLVFPPLVKKLMAHTAKLMTRTTYWI